MLRELARARDVVGVRMRFHVQASLRPYSAQHGEIALDLLVHRVDDQGITRSDVEQQVRIGAGKRIEQLDRVHGREFEWSSLRQRRRGRCRDVRRESGRMSASGRRRDCDAGPEGG
jgi:hypothetical protein